MPKAGFVCRHCGTSGECYTHCQNTEDGKHVADPASAQPANGPPDFTIDFNCIKCGQSGAVAINPDDIQWD
jgi:hypothetical protein